MNQPPIHQTGEPILNGDYLVEEFIGQGNFGQVYRARQMHIGRSDAVKVLGKNLPGIGTTAYENGQQRFQQEIMFGGKLDHPNLVRVYAATEWQGRLYLMMEYCAGGTLRDRIKAAQETNRPISISEAVRIGLDVARGLAAIHARSAVHRDLKPSNIFFDAAGTAKIGDFGVVQIRGGTIDRTLLGDAAPPQPGTDEYMSPEQRTSRASLQPPSDVYTLGAVLFEMLTGRVYYMEEPGMHAKSLRDETPVWLDDLIARMLAQSPKDRPWNGARAAELLEQGQRGEREKAEAEAKAKAEADAKVKVEAEERARRQEGKAEPPPPELPLDDAELRILAVLRAHEHRVAVQKIVAESGLPPDVVRRSLADLKQREYVYQDAGDNVPGDHDEATYFTAKGRWPEINRRVAAHPQAGRLRREIEDAVRRAKEEEDRQAAAMQARQADVAPPRKWPVGWILLALGLVVVITWAVTRPGSTVVTPTPTALSAPTKAPAAALPTATSGPTQAPAPTKAPAAPTKAPEATKAPEPTKAPAAVAPATVSAPTKAASAASDKPSFTVNQTTINVRTGPGTNYPITVVLHQGDSYEITGKNAAGGWWQFTYQGNPAWVSSDVVKLNGATSDVPTSSASTLLQPTPSAGSWNWRSVGPFLPTDGVISIYNLTGSQLEVEVVGIGKKNVRADNATFQVFEVLPGDYQIHIIATSSSFPNGKAEYSIDTAELPCFTTQGRDTVLATRVLEFQILIDGDRIWSPCPTLW